MPQQYPLSAVVGSDDLVLALLLAAVAPDIGGVLVRGEKGTAKTTAVRALAAVLPPIDVIAGDRFSTDPNDPAPVSPDGPFPTGAPVETRPVRLVELPVGATEDRVLGSLHLQRVLADGVAEYEPGLLAGAHRGILYVDEVNLLHDHLVDVLLDAAATGRVSIERDGVSVAHDARFVLIGTMNPEEGELRPQLLDRFGMTVEVAASRDPRQRAEVVRSRLRYDADPDAFVARFAADEARLRDRIVAARALLGAVELDEATLLRIAEVCAAFEVDGMRADIVMARAATAHAAWEGRTSITSADLKVAARLALPHRRRRNPFDAPGLDEDHLDQLLDQPEPDPEPDPPAGGDDPGGRDRESPPPADTEGPATNGQPSPGQPATTAPVGEPYRARLFTVPGVGRGEAGRRSPARTDTGRRVGAARPVGPTGTMDLLATLRAAAPHQHRRGRRVGRLLLAAEDLRVPVKLGRESNQVLFCVDASGSMAASNRMRAVKTAILSLLTDAYQRRDKVGLVTFRGGTADLVLPPTGSVEVAVTRLRELPAGGRTPLAEALGRVAEVVRVEAVRDPRRRPLLVLVT
ncbi:MAG: VWA domain-containing protein, partial [Actinophytocola sp.]|uniref:VWA domain-containing protein n=1 Tax=Actinophytocola sp. TaxID=1872138 RepID=UPI003C795A1B